MIRYKHSNDVVFTDLNGEAAILNTKTGIYFTLDESGTFIWNCLKESKSIDELVLKVMEEYDVEHETCIRDVKELLEEMKKESLVQEHD